MKKGQCLVPLLMVGTVVFSFNCAGIKSLMGPKGYVLQYQMDEGTIYFAYTRGMFVHMETDSEAEGIITVIGAGIEIPQQMTTKARVNFEFGQ